MFKQYALAFMALAVALRAQTPVVQTMLTAGITAAQTNVAVGAALPFQPTERSLSSYVAGTAYSVGDLILFANGSTDLSNASLYVALVAHTGAATFATDNTQGNWSLVGNAAGLRNWAGSTAYGAGQLTIENGTVIKRNVPGGISRPSFDSTEAQSWTLIGNIQPAAVPVVAFVDSEQMLVLGSAVAGAPLGVTRAAGGTTGAVHAAGATVYLGAAAQFGVLTPSGSCSGSGIEYVNTSLLQIYSCVAGTLVASPSNQNASFVPGIASPNGNDCSNIPTQAPAISFSGTIYTCQSGHYAPIAGTSGGTLTGLTAGPGLTGGGTSGNVPLSLAPAAIGTIGGVQALTPSTHQWIDSINTSGLPHTSQPASADLSDVASIVKLTTAQALTNKNLTDGSNVFPTFNQNTTGTAAALAGTPTQCSGQLALGITASGNANCATIPAVLGFTPQNAAVANSNNDALGAASTAQSAAQTYTQTYASNASNLAIGTVSAGLIPLLNQNTTGQAGTALALAATPAACPSGQAPTGVLANGNATGCAAIVAGATTPAVSSLLRGNGLANGVVAAVPNTDYLPVASPAITGTATFNGTPLGSLATQNAPMTGLVGSNGTNLGPANASQVNGALGYTAQNASTANTNNDALGAAANVQTASVQKSANGSDFTSPATVRTNLGLTAYATMPTVSGDSTINPATGASVNLRINGQSLSGVSLPGSCTVPAFFTLTSATSGQNLYACVGGVYVLQTNSTASGATIPATTVVLAGTGSAGNSRAATPDVDFQSAVVINPVASFSCVLDGVADNTACLLAMNAAILTLQAADTTDSVSFRIQPPTGKPCHFRYTNNRWTWGIKRIFLDMPGCTIQDILSDGITPLGIEKYPLVVNGGAFYEASMTCFFPACNINSSVDAGDLISTANPGDTTVTLITPSANTKYSVGDWVFVYSYNQSPVVPGLFPPHARYFDWAKVTAINSGVLSLDRPVTYLHSSTYPEDPNYLSQNQSPAGMARVLPLKNPTSGIGPTERFSMNGVSILANPNTTLTPSQQFIWLHNVINASFTNCDILSLGPEITMSMISTNTDYGNIEADQMNGYLEFDGGSYGTTFNGQGVVNMTLKGGFYAGEIIYNPRVLNVTGVTANGATQPTGNNNNAFGFDFNQVPSRVNIQSSILNGKNTYGDIYVGQPNQPSITLGSAQGAAITGNATVTAPFFMTVTGTLTPGSPTITGVTNAAAIATANDGIIGTGIQSGAIVSSVSGTTITMNVNATATGAQSLKIFMNPNWKFWSCLEQGGVVSATPTSAGALAPDGIPRSGTVQSINGGLTQLQATFKFNGTIPTTANLSCNTTPVLNLEQNKYNNWTLEVGGTLTANVTPPYPAVPSLNVEDIIQGNGRFHNYRFDTTNAGPGQTLNVFSVIKKIIVDVTQPYTGSDTTATMLFTAGTPATNETINLAIPGRREIYPGQTINAQTGDLLAPLGYFYAGTVNLVQINQAGQRQLTGTQAQQALYTVTLETESPYRSNIQ
jgi:hypothetical protein